MNREASMDDKEQSQRFIEKARELGADESGKKFERALKKLVPPVKRRRPKPKKSTHG